MIKSSTSGVKFLIEFRSGSFFRALEDDHGSSRENARRFDSREEADAFGNAHEWIWFNGGMIIEVPS